MGKNENMPGEAYCFFYCNAPKTEIESELPVIRKLVNTPSQLELTLLEGMENVSDNPKLKEIAQDAKREGINFMLKAACLGMTNRDTSERLAAILNQAYQSPLYQDGEQYRGQIIYEEDGNYVSRD